MPTNKNALTRYALIDRMLANRHKAYSIQDITDELAEKLPSLGQEGVSKRCVEKDLNYLEFDSPFNVEIEEYWIDASDKNDRPYQKRCIRYFDPTFSIFKPKLTEDEKSVLSIALDTLGQFEGLENFEWLRDLKERLNFVERQPIISLSKNIHSNSTLIARLFTAISLHQVIILCYHTFINSDSKEVSIVPYLIKEYNNRWFLIGSACDTGKILTFPLDRIDDFTIDFKNSYIPAPLDLTERYEEIIGVTFNEEQPLEKITFWVSDKSKDYIETKPIHGSQTRVKGVKDHKLRDLNPKLKGGTFFYIECRLNYELIRELTSYGPELVVISPGNIVATIKERLSASLARYN